MNKANVLYCSPQILASLPQETPVLLAFSGGADSSALLHLLHEDSQEKGFPLHVAHFHHGIRDAEADRDAEFCRVMASRLGVPFHIARADVPSLAKENGNSIETEARVQRYEFFEKIMRENNIPILVTAHHAEDQVESILLHILRGSGLKGLCGMQECRELASGLYLVRPILKSQKKDILALCEQNNIGFVTDSTNADTKYARNALRLDIIPKLCELQPNLCGTFDRLSKSASEADDFISACAYEFIETECTDNIPLQKLNQLFDAQKAKALSILFEENCSATLERVHVDALIELCQKAVPHSSVSLPNKTRATIENGSLIFEYDSEAGVEEIDFLFPFDECEYSVAQGVTLKIVKNPDNHFSKSDLSIDVSAELISADAHFRPRREGDTILSGKMNKKVKKLMSEKKISLDMRKKLPILISNDKILWIPSVAISDKVREGAKSLGGDFFRITLILDNN